MNIKNFLKHMWNKLKKILHLKEDYTVIVLHGDYIGSYYENVYVDLNYGGTGMYPIDVPSSIKFKVYLFRKNDDVYISTEKTEKFFFFIPFTYDQANIHVTLTDKTRNITGKDLMGYLDHVVYDALRWNRNGKYTKPTKTYIEHCYTRYGYDSGYKYFSQITPE